MNERLVESTIAKFQRISQEGPNRRGSVCLSGPGILAGFSGSRLGDVERGTGMSGVADGGTPPPFENEEMPFNDNDLVELRGICWHSLHENSPRPEAVALIPPDETEQERSTSSATSTTPAPPTPMEQTFPVGQGLDPANQAGPLGWFATEDVSSPSTKRKMQNRAASARFRERARQRASELEKHKEALSDMRDQLEACVKQTQESTLQWMLSNFKLRRRIHFKTVGKALVWMLGPLVTSSLEGDAMCTE